MGTSAVRVGCLAVAVLLGPFLGGANAQRNQPIYPAYDGFLKNPDGSFTLSFAYFSHNAETVTIPPGPDNSFAPNPADRQQPITFKPGHWRFQCVMVVGPDFDGKMVWTLAYSGTTTGTSQRMMQSNYNLVEGAEELSKIDYAKAPRGVCLNRAPIVRLLGGRARPRRREDHPALQPGGSEPVRQRRRRRPSAQREAHGWLEVRARARHGEIRESAGGADARDVQRAGHV